MVQASEPSESRYWLAGGSKALPHLTVAGLRFAAEHSRLLDLNLFFSEAKLERLGGVNVVETQAAQQLISEMRQHDSLLAEVVVCRVVDNFLCYITDLLALIYEERPEMLRSAEQERLDFILQYQSMDELRTAIAEKKVERLAYLGLRDLAAHMQSNMGFSLFPSDAQLEQAALLVEYRNLFVHTRGIVSATSARRFPTLKAELGKRVAIHLREVRELRQFLENAVLEIDVRAVQKFGLPTVDLPPHPDEAHI